MTTRARVLNGISHFNLIGPAFSGWWTLIVPSSGLAAVHRYSPPVHLQVILYSLSVTVSAVIGLVSDSGTAGR